LVLLFALVQLGTNLGCAGNGTQLHNDYGITGSQLILARPPEGFALFALVVEMTD
jgi:hypothetical protein